MDYLFDAKLCCEEEAEEKQIQEQLAAIAEEEQRSRTLLEPVVSVQELRQQQKGRLC